jgi:hypothetical protein
LLKTNKLLIFRLAKNAPYHEIAPNWNVSGTRTFQPASEFRGEDSDSSSGNCAILPEVGQIGQYKRVYRH